MIGKRDKLKGKEENLKALLENANFEKLNLFSNPSKMDKFRYWQEKEISLRTTLKAILETLKFEKLSKILGFHLYP